LHDGLEEDTEIGVRFLVINRSAVVSVSTDTLVVVESDVIRRVAIDGMDFLFPKQSSDHFFIRAVATDETMISKSEHIARFNISLLGFFDFFLFVKIIVFEFKDVIPDIGEVAIIEADI
jgi:hypothetical protein